MVNTIPVGNEPTAVSADRIHVWVANFGDNTVTELYASHGSLAETIAVGDEPLAVSSDGSHAWATSVEDNTVTELDASDGRGPDDRPGAAIPPPSPPTAPTSGWPTTGGDTVTELYASDGSVAQTIGLIGGFLAISSDGTHVWVDVPRRQCSERDRS